MRTSARPVADRHGRSTHIDSSVDVVMLAGTEWTVECAADGGRPRRPSVNQHPTASVIRLDLVDPAGATEGMRPQVESSSVGRTSTDPDPAPERVIVVVPDGCAPVRPLAATGDRPATDRRLTDTSDR